MVHGAGTGKPLQQTLAAIQKLTQDGGKYQENRFQWQCRQDLAGFDVPSPLRDKSLQGPAGTTVTKHRGCHRVKANGLSTARQRSLPALCWQRTVADP